MPLPRFGKPGWQASLPADVVLAAGVQVITTWQLDWSEGGSWDGGQRFTVDRAGTYLVGVELLRAGVASSSPVIVRISLNDISFQQTSTVTTAGTISGATTALLRCVAGDTVRVECRLHTTLSATLTAQYCKWWGLHLGPERWT